MRPRPPPPFHSLPRDRVQGAHTNALPTTPARSLGPRVPLPRRPSACLSQGPQAEAGTRLASRARFQLPSGSTAGRRSGQGPLVPPPTIHDHPPLLRFAARPWLPSHRAVSRPPPTSPRREEDPAPPRVERWRRRRRADGQRLFVAVVVRCVVRPAPHVEPPTTVQSAEAAGTSRSREVEHRY